MKQNVHVFPCRWLVLFFFQTWRFQKWLFAFCQWRRNRRRPPNLRTKVVSGPDKNLMRPNYVYLVFNKSQSLHGACPKMSCQLEAPFSKIVTKIFKSRHTLSPLSKTLYSRPCPHAIKSHKGYKG